MKFVPDYSGLASIRVEVTNSTVPKLTRAIYNDSQRYVPVLTGDLKRSGRTEYIGDTGYVIYGGGDVEYAAYQEFGTSIMDAQPYLRPAAYQVRGRL